MLLGKLKVILVTIMVLSAAISIAYLSKPDRGGLTRCQEVFGLDSLDRRGLEMLPFYTWSPFENRKFKMRIKIDKIDDLKYYLFTRGYEEWKEGGIQFGSLETGWDGTAAVQYSIRKFGGNSHLVAYDSTNHLIYAIVCE